MKNLFQPSAQVSFERLIQVLRTETQTTDEDNTDHIGRLKWSVSSGMLCRIAMDTTANNRVKQCKEAVKKSKSVSERYTQELFKCGSFPISAVREYREPN